MARPATGPARRRPRAQRGAAGFSLIEVLICVALVGSWVLALATGMLTLVRTAESTSQRQQIQIALGSFTESLVTGPYLPCPIATAADYQTAYGAWGPRWQPDKDGMTATVTGVEYWNELTDEFEPDCTAPDAGAQRLTVEIDWDGRIGTAQVVKAMR